MTSDPLVWDHGSIQWLVLLLLLVAAIAALALAVEPARAYNSEHCGGGHLRWAGQSTTYDEAAGIPEGWWQAAIMYANAYWDDPSVGAAWDFWSDRSSNNDWIKVYNSYTERRAEASIYVSIFNNCEVVRVVTAFNTRYTWADCDPCPSGTLDVRSIAGHEFGHWLVLGHAQNRVCSGTICWYDNDCMMYPKDHDRTLCQHDKDMIRHIYGKD